jgi:hypothetical protein
MAGTIMGFGGLACNDSDARQYPAGTVAIAGKWSHF